MSYEDCDYWDDVEPSDSGDRNPYRIPEVNRSASDLAERKKTQEFVDIWKLVNGS